MTNALSSLLPIRHTLRPLSWVLIEREDSCLQVHDLSTIFEEEKDSSLQQGTASSSTFVLNKRVETFEVKEESDNDRRKFVV